jgi:hypothetical protein
LKRPEPDADAHSMLVSISVLRFNGNLKYKP